MSTPAVTFPPPPQTPAPGPEAHVTNSVPRKSPLSIAKLALPLLVAAAFLTVWYAGVRFSGSDIFPTPIEVLRGIVELIQKGLLFKYVVASLFRVTWGFTLAVLIGVPFGLVLGWY